MKGGRWLAPPTSSRSTGRYHIGVCIGLDAAMSKLTKSRSPILAQRGAIFEAVSPGSTVTSTAGIGLALYSEAAMCVRLRSACSAMRTLRCSAHALRPEEASTAPRAAHACLTSSQCHQRTTGWVVSRDCCMSFIIARREGPENVYCSRHGASSSHSERQQWRAHGNASERDLYWPSSC